MHPIRIGVPRSIEDYVCVAGAREIDMHMVSRLALRDGHGHDEDCHHSRQNVRLNYCTLPVRFFFTIFS